MKAANRYYQESGRHDPLALAKTLTVCIPLALVGGGLYAVVAEYCPLIYLTVVVCMLFAFGMGKLMGRLLVQAKTRSTALAAVLAGVLAVICQYTILVVFLWFATGQTLLVTAPDTMTEVLGLVAEQRTITVGKPGRGGGIPFTGLGLQLVWTAEFLILLWAMVKSTLDEMEGRVFCEGCDRWIEEGFLVPLGPPEDSKALVASLEAAQYQALLDLGGQTGPDGSFLVVSVLRCPECQGTPHLSAVLHVPGTDDSGNEIMDQTVVLRNLVVDGDLVEKLQETLEAAVQATEERPEESPGETAAAPGEPTDPGGSPPSPPPSEGGTP